MATSVALRALRTGTAYMAKLGSVVTLMLVPVTRNNEHYRYIHIYLRGNIKDIL